VSQVKRQAFKADRETVGRTDLVTPSGPQAKKYLYPDLARYLCAAWLAYTFGESLSTGLKMTPTDPAELGSLWHKLSDAVFNLAASSLDGPIAVCE